MALLSRHVRVGTGSKIVVFAPGRKWVNQKCGWLECITLSGKLPAWKKQNYTTSRDSKEVRGNTDKCCDTQPALLFCFFFSLNNKIWETSPLKLHKCPQIFLTGLSCFEQLLRMLAWPPCGFACSKLVKPRNWHSENVNILAAKPQQRERQPSTGISRWHWHCHTGGKVSPTKE